MDAVWETYLSNEIKCSCGRTHKTDIKDILIGEGVVDRIPELIHKYGYRNVLLVADQNTHPVAGKRIEKLCGESDVRLATHVFEDDFLVPDEASVGRLLTAVPLDADLILAVGTGTLNDLCRYVSFRLGLDYVVVATAPSMDGFASTVAPLIVNHMKKTFPAKAPVAIIGDASIMKNAPMDLIRAGVGDILGKYVSLCDWRLSHMVTGEYYCESIVEMVRTAVKKVVDHSEGIQRRDGESIVAIMEALVLSGIAMAFAGNSRPASGSEHHLAHYFEILFLIQNRRAVFHGTKVGIGTIVVRKLYEKLQNERVDFKEAKRKAEGFDLNVWKKEIKGAYGEELAGQVVELEREVGKNRPESVMKRIDTIQEIYPKIKRMLEEELPDAETIVQVMETINAPVRPDEIEVDDAMLVNGIRYAKDIRNRYGLFQLLFDLGWMEHVEHIL